MERFVKINTQSRELNTVQDNVDRVLREYTKREVNDSVLIEGVTLDNNVTTKIEHGLGRFVRGWIIARQDLPGWVYESIPTPDDTDVYLNLRTTVPTVTLSLIVF